MEYNFDKLKHAMGKKDNMNNKFFELIYKYYKYDKIKTKDIIFSIRDKHNGLGIRDNYRKIMNFIASKDSTIVIDNICTIVKIGRFDDIIDFWDYTTDEKLKSFLISFIKTELNKKGSLISKWMPSENASNPNTIVLAKKMIKALGMTPRNYRKMLSKLRADLNLVENKLRQGLIININDVPRVARKKYHIALGSFTK